MKTLGIVLVTALVGLSATGCGVSTLNVKFVEPKIAQWKGKGNRVIVGEGTLVGDVLAIEVLKSGKFQIAGHTLPEAPKAAKTAPPEAKPAPAPVAAPVAPVEGAATPADAAPASEPAQVAAPEPAARADEGAWDYVFSVNTNTRFYKPGTNDYPATYSFTVTARSGEIIYIKALSGGDLKAELALTIGEVAGLLL